MLRIQLKTAQLGNRSYKSSEEHIRHRAPYRIYYKFIFKYTANLTQN